MTHVKTLIKLSMIEYNVNSWQFVMICLVTKGNYYDILYYINIYLFSKYNEVNGLLRLFYTPSRGRDKLSITWSRIF
jgi:hypothetical protein